MLNITVLLITELINDGGKSIRHSRYMILNNDYTLI